MSLIILSLISVINVQEDANSIQDLVMCCGLPMWGMLFYSCELPATQKLALATLVRDFGMTWEAADDTADNIIHQAVRKRGDRTMNLHISSAEEVGWWGKCCHVIMASGDIGLTVAEIVRSLPTVDKLRELIQTMDACCPMHTVHTNNNIFVMLAAVCETLEQHEHVLVYAAAALETDMTKAGTRCPKNLPYESSI